MPRYFIHTDDGDVAHRDDEGHELPNMQAARAAALDALPDMARDKLPDGDRRQFKVIVEDENGGAIYEAALELTGGWRTAIKKQE